ncbi:MAG TPA: hypothetical protein VIA06_11525 [Candidatus Dormibacteraeota bacterium]|nr:hypothetical protein [Candidatus Dormibacteraeota bacterium]
MRGDARGPLVLAASWTLLIVLCLVALLIADARAFGLALRWALLLGGLIWLAYLVHLSLRGWSEDDGPALLPRGRARRPGRPRPMPQLAELERLMEFASATAFDVHYRLRPRLVGIATHRLARRGIALKGQPEQARAAVGATTWALIAPDRRPPEQRHGPGIQSAELQQILEEIDAL